MDIKTDYSEIKWKNNGKLKLLIIVGTRPEIIRLAAVINNSYRCRQGIHILSRRILKVRIHFRNMSDRISCINKIENDTGGHQSECCSKADNTDAAVILMQQES